jgi:hypothetical protein
VSLPIDVDQLSAVQAKKSANKGMSTLDHVLLRHGLSTLALHLPAVSLVGKQRVIIFIRAGLQCGALRCYPSMLGRLPLLPASLGAARHLLHHPFKGGGGFASITRAGGHGMSTLARRSCRRVDECLVQPSPKTVGADPSFRALCVRLKFTVRRHKFNKKKSLSGCRW